MVLEPEHFASPHLGKHFVVFKGPKLEIFGSRVFTQIRSVWVGDLGTRQKNSKILWFRLEKFKRYRRRRKKILSAVGNCGKKFKRCQRYR
jgi:hypothetical protein